MNPEPTELKKGQLKLNYIRVPMMINHLMSQKKQKLTRRMKSRDIGSLILSTKKKKQKKPFRFIGANDITKRKLIFAVCYFD